MFKSKFSSVIRMTCAAAVVALSAGMVTVVPTDATAVSAQEQKKKPPKSNRKVQTMGQAFYKRMEKGIEAMEAGLLDESEQIFRELIARRKTNSYERTVAWQQIATISFEREDTDGAIAAMEEVLKLRDNIRESHEHQILYSLAQLHFSQENVTEALKYIAEWEKLGEWLLVDPTITQRVFIASLHYQMEDYKTSLEYMYSAINEAEANPEIEVKEQWYLTAASSHYEMGDLIKYRDTVEILLVRWGKPNYMLQLAGVYSELEDEETFYALYEAAYKMGYLDDKPTQIVTVAQIMFAVGAPVKAAWVLDDAFKEGLVDDADPKNQKLLGQAYMMSQDYDKSVGPLSKAAEIDNDAEGWFQVGQVEMQNANYKGASDALTKAIDLFSKSDDKKDKNARISAMMLKGNALTEMKRYDEADAIFRQVQRIGSKRQQRQAGQWVRYVKGEVAREKMLTGE